MHEVGVIKYIMDIYLQDLRMYNDEASMTSIQIEMILLPLTTFLVGFGLSFIIFLVELLYSEISWRIN